MRRLIATVAVAGAAVFGAGHALGASEDISTSGECCSYGKDTYTIDRGTLETFHNIDPGTSPHNVTAVDFKADGKPLFDSSTIRAGQTSVQGTDSLPAGTYRFFCTVHPLQMFGKLVVTPRGSPTVAVKILSRNLSAVAAKGKLQVKLRGLVASNGVSLTARAGKRKLGTMRGISLRAGRSLTVRLPLTRSGRNSLRRHGAAKLKVTATPPGDKPASAKRRLH